MAALAVYLGVDIGTSEAKAVIVDSHGLNVAEVRRAHTPIIPSPGRMEHDPQETWWKGFVHLTRELVARANASGAEIRGVCVSGIGPCVLPIDDAGAPLRNAILYGVDGRASDQIARLRKEIGDNEILARGGTELSSQSAGPKILWIEEEEPAVFGATHLFVSCNTFIVGRLTDRNVIDHATAAYFHPLYDRRTSSWNLDGYPGRLQADQLPELGWSSDIAGVISPDAARWTGLAAGTPVLVGGPDSPFEALASGIVKPGPMMLMYGSSHFALALREDDSPVPGLWPAPYLWPGSFLVAGGTATAGSYLRWLCEILRGDDGPLDFASFVRLAANSPPGARGLVALPYLSGERTPLNRADLRAGFFGFSMLHTRADIARAGIEAVAQSAAAVIRAFENAGIYPDSVRAVGGGTRNDLWLEAVSNMTGHAQSIVQNAGAAFGGAILTAKVLEGTSIDSLSDASRQSDRPVTPEPALRPVYERQRRLFDALREGTLGLLTDLLPTEPQ